LFFKEGIEMNKKITGVLIIIIIILAAFAGVNLWNSFNSYARILNANWGIDIPGTCEEEYVKTGEEDSFFGDGDRYRILKVDGELIDGSIDFESADRISDHAAEYAATIMNNLRVPYDKRPDMSQMDGYYYQQKDDNDVLILLYDEEQGLLYVLEEFI
jgi:hypothetical protein